MIELLQGLEWFDWFMAVPLALLVVVGAGGLLVLLGVTVVEAVAPPIPEDRWLYRGKLAVLLVMLSFGVGMAGMVFSI